MTHTLPDYSTRYKMTTIFGNIDDAELAARLGSPVTFDRRGNVVWMDDFENTLNKWGAEGNGVGNSQAVNITRARNKTTSVLLTCGSTVAVSSRIFKWLILPVETSIGTEISFSLGDDLDHFDFILRIYDGSNHSYCWLQIDFANSKITYYNDVGGFTDLITGITWDTTFKTWYTIKMVCDYATGKYVRMIFGNKTVDMSTIPMRVLNSGTYPQMRLYLTAYGTAATNATMYLDDFILTQNE